MNTIYLLIITLIQEVKHEFIVMMAKVLRRSFANYSIVGRLGPGSRNNESCKHGALSSKAHTSRTEINRSFNLAGTGCAG